MNTPDAHQSRLVEQLKLNLEWSDGLISRLYESKRILEADNVKVRPAILTCLIPGAMQQSTSISTADMKAADTLLKNITKKLQFGTTLDNKLTQDGSVRKLMEIFRVGPSFKFHYDTLTEALDFKRRVATLLVEVNAAFVASMKGSATVSSISSLLDAKLQFDVLVDFMNLLKNYWVIFELIVRIDHRKTVVTLFNLSHLHHHGMVHDTLPTLAQLIIDLDPPKQLRRLSEDLSCFSPLILSAINSLYHVYQIKAANSEKWKKDNYLDVQTSAVESSCEDPELVKLATGSLSRAHASLSLEDIDHWLYIAGIVCPQQLLNPSTGGVAEMWRTMLTNNLTLTLHKKETIPVHESLSQYFDAIKQPARMKEVKSIERVAAANVAKIRADRRTYLRLIGARLTTLVQDEPGLLGPLMTRLLEFFAAVRSEILWLLRHDAAMTDGQLPELMYWQFELQTLLAVDYTADVVCRWNAATLRQYDTAAVWFALDAARSSNHSPSETACNLLDAIRNHLDCFADGNVSTEMIEAFQLDWARLQLLAGAPGGFLGVRLASALNGAAMRSQLCTEASVRQTVLRAADLSSFFAYDAVLRQLATHFRLPATWQLRYASVWIDVCAHFPMAIPASASATDAEGLRAAIIRFAISQLEELVVVAVNVFVALCRELLALRRQLDPAMALTLIKARFEAMQEAGAKSMARKSKGTGKKRRGGPRSAGSPHPPAQSDPFRPTLASLPGAESRRGGGAGSKSTMTENIDEYAASLCDVLHAIEHRFRIPVCNYWIYPKETLSEMLLHHISVIVANFAAHGSFTGTSSDAAAVPQRPSRTLAAFEAVLTAVKAIESWTSIDTSELIHCTLVTNSQPALPAQPAAGQTSAQTPGPTVTGVYRRFYTETLMQDAEKGSVVFSTSRRAFLSIATTSSAYVADEYADPYEFVALAKLIGPFGVRQLVDGLDQSIGKSVASLLRIDILRNRDTLREVRRAFSSPMKMASASATLPLELKSECLRRLAAIGCRLELRQCLQRGLAAVLADQLPFFSATIADLASGRLGAHHEPAISELTAAAGRPGKFDPALRSALKQALDGASAGSCSHNMANGGESEDEELAALLLTLVAVALPHVARCQAESSDSADGAVVGQLPVYLAEKDAVSDNSHCLATAVNALSAALFPPASTLAGSAGHSNGSSGGHSGGHDAGKVNGDQQSAVELVKSHQEEFLALLSIAALRMPPNDEPLSAGASGAVQRATALTHLQIARIVDKSDWLTADMLETCFPYALVHAAYRTLTAIGSR